MKSRIHEVPTTLVENVTVDAQRYNMIRLALLRFGTPQRVPLLGLRHLDMLLEEDRWVCVDRSALDLPVAAWVRFQNRAQDNLQAPVDCQLRHYQVNTDIVLPYVWMALENILQQKLHDAYRHQGCQIISFGSFKRR